MWAYVHENRLGPPGRLGLAVAQHREDCLAAAFGSQSNLTSFPTSFFNDA